MAACTSGGRAGAALSASASSHNRAKASWLRTRPGNSCSEARRSSSSAAAGQVSPRARKGSSCSPARNWVLACPVSWTHSRWQLPSGSSTSGARLSTRCPAGTLWGGSSSAAPAGRGPAEGTLAVAGQGEGRAGLHVLHLTGRGHGIPVKQQYPTPQINKMLFYITK